MIKIVFFGTHDFAAEILQSLLDNSEVKVELVITQPDKPVGRKQILEKSAVKILAEKYSIRVAQPESLKKFDLKILENFDLGVCAQYGLIIPQAVLDAPKMGILNVHTSLLPKYRGASPVQTALLNGETKTGITIMKMDAGMDTGPILTQNEVNIAPDDTYTTLSETLAKTAKFALTEAILGYIRGTIVPEPQNPALATYTKILSREDGQIDWTKPAKEIYNQYRGLTPWPGIWTMLDKKRVKLLKVKPSEKNFKPETWNCELGNLYMGCGQNSLEVLELQMEGSKTTTAKDFINGHKNLCMKNT